MRVKCGRCGASAPADTGKNLSGAATVPSKGHYTACGLCAAPLLIIDDEGATRVVTGEEINAMSGADGFRLGLACGMAQARRGYAQ